MAKEIVVIGLGKTGLSCARYLAEKDVNFIIADTRNDPPYLDTLKSELPDITVHLGPLSDDLLLSANELVVSPGISLMEPAIQRAMKNGVEIIGDVELFCREVSVPVVAVTGSNGKSTLTVLLGMIAKHADIKVAVGGNIGIPVLDLLTEDVAAELYVLELSSFQLETTHSLNNHIALFLNISADHMDRYPNMTAYIAAKKRIYSCCKAGVYNLNDLSTWPDDDLLAQCYYFSLDDPVDDVRRFGIKQPVKEKVPWLAHGNTLLMPISELPMLAPHYQLNMLAAFAVAHLLSISVDITREVIRTFEGLPHRCQRVGETRGVIWFNDSKATNVSSSLASISGLGQQCPGKLILLAGGQGKGVDFSALGTCIDEYVSVVIVYGEDGGKIKDVVSSSLVQVIDATSHNFRELIVLAYELAQSGDWILLAPACASFDMFKNFEARGEQFVEYINEIACAK